MFSFKRVSSLRFSNLLVAMTIILFLATPAAAETNDLSQSLPKDFKYQNLFKSLDASERSTNFMAFTDFIADQEKGDHGASLEYLSSHPDLINQIRDDLGSKEIHWQLEELSSRLLYIPESRVEVAGLFTDYCRDTIEDLLDRTGLSNPYSSISILGESAAAEPDGTGINAVIVQDLAREYVARYQFSGNSEKRIEIGLSGRNTINEVGSYSSFLKFSEEKGDWKFLRNQQTIWKSVSANPYTVLMTPLEETLHIALRAHTEKAILAAVKAKLAIPSLKEIRDVVEEWLAVEEAIVGGLVYFLIPDVVIRRIPDLPREWIQADLETKAQFPKYRFLPKAIKMVEDFGLKKSIHSYAQDPVATRSLLIEPS
ncbi:MAG: hypothetical protein GY799_16670 [Desulfobulbaceae bacterium]|nr:hypothetical protein [Desulfobulbaceae bacterium]